MTLAGPGPGAGSVASIDQTSPPRGARVSRVPPPLYYAGAFATALLAREVIVPLEMGARSTTRLIGAVAVGAGVLLTLAGVVAVLWHRTTIVPHRPVSVLVTTGAYRISRNPMYTGLAIAYIGGSLLAHTWWPLITLPAALLGLRRLVIDPEELYLSRHFAQAYTDYQQRVRRWL